jgi:hypothetical protein
MKEHVCISTQACTQSQASKQTTTTCIYSTMHARSTCVLSRRQSSTWTCSSPASARVLAPEPGGATTCAPSWQARTASPPTTANTCKSIENTSVWREPQINYGTCMYVFRAGTWAVSFEGGSWHGLLTRLETWHGTKYFGPCRHDTNTEVVPYLESQHGRLHGLTCILGHAWADTAWKWHIDTSTTIQYNFLAFTILPLI